MPDSGSHPFEITLRALTVAARSHLSQDQNDSPVRRRLEDEVVRAEKLLHGYDDLNASIDALYARPKVS